MAHRMDCMYVHTVYTYLFNEQEPNASNILNCIYIDSIPYSSVCGSCGDCVKHIRNSADLNRALYMI